MIDKNLDYGSIAMTCNYINDEYLDECSFEDMELIFSNYLFFLSHEELSVRMAAVNGFTHFFKAILK